MPCILEFYLLLVVLVSITCEFSSDKGDCQLTVTTGQVVRIQKPNYRHCNCIQNVSSKLLLNSGPGVSFIQFLASDKETGKYEIKVDSSSCLDLSVIPINGTDPSKFKCNLRWPTLAAITLDVDLSQMDQRQRIMLWNALKSNIKGAAGLRLIEDIASFEKSIFILASGLGNSDGKRRKQGVAVVWQIGCGSVELRHLKTLQWLEKSCLIGEFSELIGGYPVEMWLVADLYGREKIIRMKREAIWQRNRLNTSSRSIERIRDSMFSGILIEGSGLSTINAGSGDKSKSTLQNISLISRIITSTISVTTIGSPTPFVPVVRRNLNKISLTIRQINNFKIPRETFFDPQQGYSPALRIVAFYILPVSEKQIEVVNNDSNWISYDKDLQNIRFLPIPSQIGFHKLLLCAIDRDGNKVCEPLIVEVGPSTPIVKITVLQIPAGALWTYEMPSHWLDGLTFNSSADLSFAIEGDAIFSWDESRAVLQVITEAIESRILKIIFNVTNEKEFQTLKYEFTLAVSDISPISNVMSNIFQMRLRWTGPNLYPLNSIKIFLHELATILKKEKIDKAIDPDDLIIYRILHHRDFRVTSRDASPDDILTFQLVFRPAKNATCERAALRDFIPILMKRQTISYYYIDSINSIILKGKCNHENILKTISPTTVTSTSKSKMPVIEANKPPEFSSDTMIGSSYEFPAGSAFLINIDVKKAINEKLVRYLTLVDDENKNVTDDNWIGLSSNGTYIYGMPLNHNVRKEGYNFWLTVYTVTAHMLKAPFRVHLTPNKWTGGRINHIISIKLKLMEAWTENSSGKQIIDSLKFRVQLAQEIGKILRPHCYPNCAMEVVMYDLKIIDQSVLVMEWSHLAVLDTDGDLKEPGKQCPWNTLIHLYKSINGISNYPIETAVLQQVPAQALSEGLQRAQIGSVSGLAIKRQGACAVAYERELVRSTAINLIQNITVFCGQGFRVPINSVQRDKSSQPPHAFVQIYYETDIVVPKTYWMSLSASQQFIFGLPMLIHSTPAREYTLQLFPQNGKKIKSPFYVTVLSTTFQTSNLNHDVTMRMAFISHSKLDEKIVDGLDLRWKVVAALDSYIRPHCSVSTTAFTIPKCAWELDVVLFSIGRVEASSVLFDIKWSLRSLLNSDTLEKFKKENNVRAKRQITCPENGILQLKRILFDENSISHEPQQKLQMHLRINAGVKLNKVDFQRRGVCVLTEPAMKPRKGLIFKSTGPEDNQKMFLITTVIPVCAFTICILFVALMIALCMKRRNYAGYTKANQNSQLGPGSPVILPDEIDRSCSPPSKPLILPHEKPPLPPPDYNHEPSANFLPMINCSYRSPSQTLLKMANGQDITVSTFGHQQTPSIRSSLHSHDKFPRGVYG